jgi:hypothetical protein
MIENQKKLIKRWLEKSKDEENSFDRFISLWISFNAFYAAEHLLESENQQITNIKNEYKRLFAELTSDSPESFEAFKDYIETKPQNTGFIQDLRYQVDKEKHKKRYQSIGSLCEYLDCVYQVRCNLFHGGKNLEDGQDQKIVSRAYDSLLAFLEKVYQSAYVL